MRSGDKLALLYQGGGVSKGNEQLGPNGRFTLAQGTGKLKGISGKGSFRCKSVGEGVSCEVEGDYDLGK